MRGIGHGEDSWQTVDLSQGPRLPGQEFSLAEAAKAHHAVIESRAYGKIVLIP